MNRGWRATDVESEVDPFGFASEILIRQTAPTAVFDYAGKLAFANRAFRDSRLGEALLDRRQFLAHGGLEQLRMQALRQSPDSAGCGLFVEAAGRRVWVEVLRLGSAPGWTAAVAQISGRDPAEEPALPSPQLLLHELRAPVLALSEGLDQLSQVTEEGTEEQRKAINRQSRAMVRLRGVLQGVSDLIRASRKGSEGLHLTPVDLADVVTDVEDTYALLAAADGHSLGTELSPSIPTVAGDRELLGRALGNLVDNAIKHTPPGPVDIKLELRGTLAVLEVMDRGPGIPPEHRDRVFEPFVRLVPPTSTGGGGSGLGLAVVRQVMLAHGASVTLDDRPGGGAIFRLAFLVQGRVHVPSAPTPGP